MKQGRGLSQSLRAKAEGLKKRAGTATGGPSKTCVTGRGGPRSAVCGRPSITPEGSHCEGPIEGRRTKQSFADEHPSPVITEDGTKAMDLTNGTKLGPYEILAPLGAGGMGEVYRARDTRLEREVAVKVLPADLAANPDFKQRFEREAKTISSLSHPHICALYDVGHEDGVDFLVMELLEGETLAERLKRGALPAEQVQKVGIQIAEALDGAHRRGLVHRDLKPGNVMLTQSGAKLMDFGLAKPGVAPQGGSSLTAMPTQTTPLTAEGTLVGTFQYMSPEQIEGKEADVRSDIFASARFSTRWPRASGPSRARARSASWPRSSKRTRRP